MNTIGDEGVRGLSSGNLKTLTTLSLRCNRIGDEGARALSQGNLIRLKEFYL
jgi:hypothetical protein